MTALSSTSLRATWTEPDDGGDAITSYDLRYRESGTSAWTDVTDRTSRTYDITGLSAGESYEVQVRATNSVGDSGWSSNGTGETDAAVPDAPSAPTVTALSETEFRVTWTEPDDNGEAITSYDLRYRESGTSAWTDVTDRTSRTYDITGLSAGESYEVQVRATNSVGDSGWSSSTTASTSMTAPAAPSAPTVTALSSTSLRATWTEPDDGGDAITSYDLRYREAGTSAWTDVTDRTSRTYDIAGLSVATSYQVQVRATNSEGDSGWSSSTTASTSAAVPDAPSAPTVTALSSTSLRATWTAPDDGGDAITSYDIRHRLSGTATWTDDHDQPATATSADIAGLSADHTYEVQVRATNSVGDSGWSSSGSGTTLSGAVTTNVLYMVGQFNDELYTVSPTDGTATAVGTAVEFGVLEFTPVGLAFIGETLYMTGGATDRLYTVDTSTGVATQVGSATLFGVSEQYPGDLASIGDTLYMVGSVADGLYTVNTTTGVATVVDATVVAFGVSETTPRGLAAIGDTLYMVGWGNGALYTLDATTGVATVVDATVTNFGVSESQPSGLAAIDDTLYMVGRDTDALYTVDTSTGVATAVDATVTNFGVGETIPEGLATLRPATPQDAPSTPVVTVLSPSSLRVTWTAPSGSPTSYDLRYREDGTSAWTDVFGLTVTTYDIAGLTASTTYDVQVRANGSSGQSAYSSSSPQTTSTATAPDAPAAPTVMVLSSTSLRVSWTAPDDGGDAITHYDVRHRIGAGTWTQSDDITGTTTDLTGLSAGESYQVGVRAVNSVGDSGWSSSTTASTSMTAPAAPSAPTVTALSSASLRVTWTEPDDGGDAITSYDLRHREAGTAAWTDVTDRTSRTYDIAGLSAATSYQVQVRATNSEGDSGWSSTGTGETDAAAPDAPSAPTLTVLSETEFRVTWTEPDDNGEAITSYDLRYRESGTSAWTDVTDRTSRTYDIAGLSVATSYQVQVRATNSVGDSGWSSSTTASTSTTTPSAPDAPTVTALSSTSLRATWTEPDDGGDAITSYDLRYREAGTSAWTDVTDRTSRTYDITGLSVATSYQVQVRATNSEGDSGWSSSGTGETDAAAPDAPSAPTLTVLSATSIRAVWSAPASNGEAITFYDVRYRRGSAAWSQVDDITTTTTDITALSPATEYEVAVRATNSVGDSAWSSSTSATTQTTTPSAPAAPTVTGASTTSIEVEWDAPVEDGGVVVTSYDVRYRATGTVTWTQTDDITVTSATITGLSAGSTYEAQVRATNSVGDSGWSASGEGDTSPAALVDASIQASTYLSTAPSVRLLASSLGDTSASGIRWQVSVGEDDILAAQTMLSLRWRVKVYTAVSDTTAALTLDVTDFGDAGTYDNFVLECGGVDFLNDDNSDLCAGGERQGERLQGGAVHLPSLRPALVGLHRVPFEPEG